MERSIFAGRPLVKEELAEGSQKAIARLNAFNDLSNMVNDPKIERISPVTVPALREMVRLYNQYKEDTFCPTVTSPWDLDSKWMKLIEFKNKNVNS